MKDAEKRGWAHALDDVETDDLDAEGATFDPRDDQRDDQREPRDPDSAYVTLIESAAWALRYFVRLDESNACVHLAEVRYSPITFALAEALARNGRAASGVVQLVLDHVGAYDLDPGR